MTLLNPTVLLARLDVRAVYENEVGNTWLIEADAFGNFTKLTDPENNVTTWERDADGLVLEETAPDPGGPAGALQAPVVRAAGGVTAFRP